MDIAIVLVLLLAGAVVGVFDRYSVQRTYAEVYATRHGHIPPLADWFFHADPDADVEYWRRMHRNLWLVASGLGVAAILVLIVRPISPA